MEERFETFTITISKLSRFIHKIKSEEMKEFNLKSSHVSCLYYLYQHGGSLTAKELCDICDEDKASISRSIDYLEKNDFLTCHSKTEKRYKSPLELTEKGKSIAQKVVLKIDKILDSASNGLSEDSRLNFYKSLKLIADNLEIICNKYGEGDEN